MKSKSVRKKSDDAQDIEDLRAAMKRNGEKPGVPWERVKKELGLDFPRSQTEFGNEGKTS